MYGTHEGPGVFGGGVGSLQGANARVAAEKACTEQVVEQRNYSTPEPVDCRPSAGLERIEQRLYALIELGNDSAERFAALYDRVAGNGSQTSAGNDVRKAPTPQPMSALARINNLLDALTDVSRHVNGASHILQSEL